MITAGTDRPTPRWARVGAVLVIAATAIVGPMAVAVTAHDVAVRDGLLPAQTAAVAPAACGSDVDCAWFDLRRGAAPRPDVSAAQEDMCPAGWDVVGIDSDDVPAACVPTGTDLLYV